MTVGHPFSVSRQAGVEHFDPDREALEDALRQILMIDHGLRAQGDLGPAPGRFSFVLVPRGVPVFRLLGDRTVTRAFERTRRAGSWTARRAQAQQGSGGWGGERTIPAGLTPPLQAVRSGPHRALTGFSSGGRTGR